ncbi:MAG: DUF6507 family protein [Phycicoccus sp.]
MTNWDVDAAGAGRVIGAAADAAAGYVGEVGRVGDAAEALVGVLPESPLVMGQVVGFGEQVASPGVSAVAGYTHSAVQGGSDAVLAYVAGDVEMAARAQDASASATYPGDIPGTAGGSSRGGR